MKAFWPPVSAISGTDRSRRVAAIARLIALGHLSVEPVKAHAGHVMRVRRSSRGTDGFAPSPVQELPARLRGTPAVEQQFHCVIGAIHGWRLLGRLGDHAVAGGERGD